MESIVSVTILMLFSGFCFSANSSNITVWKQIKYTGTHLELASSTSVVSSPKKCAEKCTCYPLCKSFGIHTDMRCSLYDGRVWAGQNGTVEPGWFYYWLLEASCPFEKGYSLNTDQTVCHKHYDGEHLNWTSAQALCEQDGGHLFMVDTPAKRSLLDTFYNNTRVFLGAIEFEGAVWDWLNGEPVNPLEFGPNQLNSTDDVNDCLLLYYGTFRGRPCSKLRNFVCEVPLHPQL